MESLPLFSSGFLLAVSCALLLGIAKSGIKGIAVFIVTGLALAYGSFESTGILMPMLIFGDTFAVIYYKKHVTWKYIKILIPWMIVGVLLGVIFGNNIPESLFKYSMVTIVLTSVGMMYFWESKSNKKIPSHKRFGISMGILAGFTTMVGNLAGAFSNIYFLAMRLPKNEFIGTAAWLFFIINLFKVPFHIWVWKTINMESLQISIRLLPFVATGLMIGILLVKKINDTRYRKLILILTAIGGLALLIK